MKHLVACLVLLSTACGTTSHQRVAPTPPAPALPHPALEAQNVPPARNAPPNPLFVFQGVDLFGVRGEARDRVLGRMTLPAPGTSVDSSQQEFIDRLIESKKRVLEDAPYAFARFSLTQWFATHELYLTADLVERGDEWRMPFTAEPTGDVPDPEGLLAAWKDYQTRLQQLRSEGAMPEYGMGTCQASVCHGGFAHPQLAPLEQRFLEGVPRQAQALVRVLREDKDAAKRFYALMLLPYVSSREWLVSAVLPSVKDPHEGVRNEALRLLGSLQKGQPRVLIPLDAVLEALWFPLTSDRNKAGWALVSLVETEGPVHRQHILERSGAALLAMFGMKSPIEHEPAHNVLTLLAGRELGEDVAAWRQWLAEQKATPPVTRP